MSSGGGGGDSGTNVTRYAPYIEAKHETFLTNSESFGITARANNPYTDYVGLDFDDAFYGAGYIMSSFPSLYDMFGKFMAGLDIEVLWDQVLYDVQNSDTIQASVIAHRTILNEDLEQNILPRFKEGMRDINAVMSSSFVNGKAILEKGISNKLAEFDANLRYKLLPVAAEVFSKHLAWNSGMISQYLEVMKLAILTKFDTDNTNYNYALKDIMFPFTTLEQERANLGALQGAVSGSAGGGEASTGQKVLGGVMGGASLGASVGGLPGAAIGGVLGGIAGLF